MHKRIWEKNDKTFPHNPTTKQHLLKEFVKNYLTNNAILIKICSAEILKNINHFKIGFVGYRTFPHNAVTKQIFKDLRHIKP